MLLLGFLNSMYYLTLQVTPIQFILDIQLIDIGLLQTIVFLLINFMFFLLFYTLISNSSLNEQSTIIKQGTFIGIVLLIVSIQIIVLELLFVSLLVLFFSYSLYQNTIQKNSINLNKALTKKQLIQLVTQLSIFYIAFLLI